MKSFGVGIIGCGARTRWIAKLLMEADKRIRVAAVCDPSAKSVELARETFGRDLTVCGSCRELLNSPGMDWVMIGSWNCCHREHAVAALRAGKHVFCEKPLATTWRDCLAIRKAWQASGRSFYIGFTLRSAPHYTTIKRLIDAGTIGKIVSMEFNETLDFNHGGFIVSDWRRLTKNAGTHLLEKCCHDIDLANWLVGSRASRVASFGGLNFFTPENAAHVRRLGRDGKGRTAYSAFDGGQEVSRRNPFTCDKDIIDNQVAILEYANGVRATFHTNLNAGIPERRMYLCGSEGAIRADCRAGRIEIRRIGFAERVRAVRVVAEGAHAGGDNALARDLAASITRGKPATADMNDALTSAATCFGIDRAMTTGSVVEMSPYWRDLALETPAEAR